MKKGKSGMRSRIDIMLSHAKTAARQRRKQAAYDLHKYDGSDPDTPEEA